MCDQYIIAITFAHSLIHAYSDSVGGTPAHHAAYNGQLPCLKWLVAETTGRAYVMMMMMMMLMMMMMMMMLMMMMMMIINQVIDR